ncbi:SEL1-like repeat protein [Variovorax ginsengisoli]|uniref:DUF6396 domain-containing protein n=1 Tax=Variovorax ginsengisoli TaxID=363844 RepID=A0ABT9S596_9BURK|nr:DUF6396 domain-containing protein [Variovorax ginsengisoli]MDP9899530.1 hypothetical protein [Variovorax ginsengisoli]
MSNLPRNMSLKAFDPHRADFTCKYEADANPPITPESEALFQEGMAVTRYERSWTEDKRDYAKAAVLWKQAADLGHWKAALNLAGLYEQGLGMEQDTEKAVLIVEGLMKQGVPAAFDKMGTYHQRSIGVKGDTSRAYGFWQLAADMGSADAQAFLGTKMSGAYDNPGQGFWGNRKVAIKMLECSYAQGNGTGAFELGVTINGDDKSLGENYGRSLKALHDAVKFGSPESAGYLSSYFNQGRPLTGNLIDPARADRYHELRAALERNPDLRLPNLDKVLPLPPADLPMWDGDPQTLIDAAKRLVPVPKTPPSAGSQRTGRAHIPQGYGLARQPLPPAAERVAQPLNYSGHYLIDPQAEQAVVPYSGYWIARVKDVGRAFQREWNDLQIPLRYAKGETFDATDRRRMGEYARFNPASWHYLGEAIQLPAAPAHPLVVQGIARGTRVPEPLLRCHGAHPCPQTGVWVGQVRPGHPLAKVYNAGDRGFAYVKQGQRFPDPKAQHLEIEVHQVSWLWLDNANQVRSSGRVDVTLTDLHDDQGKPLA